jgi:hypothetical protein
VDNRNKIWHEMILNNDNLIEVRIVSVMNVERSLGIGIELASLSFGYPSMEVNE